MSIGGFEVRKRDSYSDVIDESPSLGHSLRQPKLDTLEEVPMQRCTIIHTAEYHLRHYHSFGCCTERELGAISVRDGSALAGWLSLACPKSRLSSNVRVVIHFFDNLVALSLSIKNSRE